MQDFNDKMEEIKNATETPETDDIPGGQIETPSDEQFKKEMEQAGFDDKTIEDMTKKKNIDGNEDYTEEEMEELKKQVVDGLEDACKKKGGSALASTIVKNATLNTIEDYEQLDAELWERVGEPYCNWGWFHKYLSMVCLDL